MKRLLILVVSIFLLFGLKTESSAADATANVTLNYSTPLTIEEIVPFSFTLVKKPGVSGENVTITNLYNELYSTKQYFSSYSYTPGCIKIKGNPNGRVKVKITPSLVITGSKSTITLNSLPVRSGQSKSSCMSSFSGPIYNSTVNGLDIITLDSNGEAYVLWFIGGENANFLFYYANVTFSSIVLDTYVAPVTYEVWYE